MCLPFFTHVHLKGDLGTPKEIQITFKGGTKSRFGAPRETEMAPNRV